MKKFIKCCLPILLILAGAIFFNLIIGVLGLHWAIISLVVFTLLAIYVSFKPQPEDNEPYA